MARANHIPTDELERTCTLEQVLLKYHFVVRETIRVQDRLANLTAAKIAEIISKAFS